MSEHPKEYIITEKQLRHYIKFSKYPSSEMDEAIRSRPHPAPAPRPPCEECIYQERIDKAARKAREDECERIYGLFHEVERLHLNGMAYPDLYNEMVARIKFIHTEPLSKDGRKKESLRSTQQQAGDP